MSIAIAYVVYGISLSDDNFNCYKNDIERLDNEEIATSYYSARDDNPVCLGVRLCSIYEKETIHLSNLTLSPTDVDKKNFEKLFNDTLSYDNISYEFKQRLAQQNPRTFIMWGSD